MPNLVNRGQRFPAQRVLHNNHNQILLPAGNLAQVKSLRRVHFHQFARIECPGRRRPQQPALKMAALQAFTDAFLSSAITQLTHINLLILLGKH